MFVYRLHPMSLLNSPDNCFAGLIHAVGPPELSQTIPSPGRWGSSPHTKNIHDVCCLPPPNPFLVTPTTVHLFSEHLLSSGSMERLGFFLSWGLSTSFFLSVKGHPLTLPLLLSLVPHELEHSSMESSAAAPHPTLGQDVVWLPATIPPSFRELVRVANYEVIYVQLLAP